MRDPNLLHSTKAVLKYLINHGPAFQTVDSISIDFYSYTGEQIPFLKLGYCYLKTFLQNIPDILHVDSITLQVRPPNNFNWHVSPNRSQITHAPLTFPLVLPWTQSYHQNVSDTHTLSLLGPRTYGDGKCSSSDSISTDHESHEQHQQDRSVKALFAETVMPSNDDPKNRFDFDIDVMKNNQNFGKKIVRFDDTLSYDELQSEVETKWNLNDNDMLPKTLSTSFLSDMIIVKPDDIAPSTFPVVKLFDNNCYDRFSTISILSDEDDDDDEDDAVPFMFDDKINMLSSSFYNGNYGCRFVTSNIDDVMEVGKVYELYVSEVNSPFKFWFQLNEEIPNPVEELQEHLNDCYNMTDCIPELIKPEHMQKGYACAALYTGLWHRGEFIGPVENGKVSIFFVDYGTVDEVNIGGIRYLLSSFCSLPKLCHRGTLDFIKPRQPVDRWTVDATSFLIELVQDRVLTAGITEIDRQNNSVRLYLIDNDANININWSFVYHGFAFPDDPRERYQHHIADVVPSFDDLETGRHASFSKVVSLLEQNFDYNDELLHKSVIDEFDFYIPTFVSKEEATERMHAFMTKTDEARKCAKKRDAKLYLDIFKNVLTNPFLNGSMTDEIAVDATNPFSDCDA